MPNIGNYHPARGRRALRLSGMAMLAALAMLAAVLGLDVQAPAPASAAGTTVCVGPLTGSLNGDVVVPAGARCDLHDATVRGNVLVEAEGRLYIDSSRIEGNIRAFGMLHFFWTDVTGNVRIEGTGESAANGACGSSIGGNLELVGNAGDLEFGALGRTSCMTGDIIGGNVRIEGNTSGVIRLGLDESIGGNVEVIGNATSFRLEIHHNDIAGHLRLVDNTGFISLAANQIGKHLQCAGNDPVPSGYSGATKLEGQCVDRDSDRVFDARDNCPDVANLGQRDIDGDGTESATNATLTSTSTAMGSRRSAIHAAATPTTAPMSTTPDWKTRTGTALGTPATPTTSSTRTAMVRATRPPAPTTATAGTTRTKRTRMVMAQATPVTRT